jgi:hypothetical protein
MVRELGLDRRETDRSLSTVGYFLNLRSLILSTRGPGKNDDRFNNYLNHKYCCIAKSWIVNY